MGASHVYYLIKRHKTTNEFEIVPVNGSIETTLEDIDLLATKGNYLDLKLDMKVQSLKEDSLYDWFIIAKQKNTKPENNEDNCMFFELPQTTRFLAPITKAKKDKNLVTKSGEINGIFRMFGFLQDQNDVGNLIRYMQTVSPEFYRRYFGVEGAFEIKNGNIDFKEPKRWALTSYKLIRFIFLVTLQPLNEMTDIDFRGIELQNTYRELIIPEILRTTSPQKKSYQFSFLEDSPGEEDHNKIIEQIKKLPDNVFRMDKTLKKVLLNEELFKGILPDDLRKLKELLPEKVRVMIGLLLQHNYLLKNEDSLPDSTKEHIGELSYTENNFQDRFKNLIGIDERNIIAWLRKHEGNKGIMEEWLNIISRYTNDNKGCYGGNIRGCQYAKRY